MLENTFKDCSEEFSKTVVTEYSRAVVRSTQGLYVVREYLRAVVRAYSWTGLIEGVLKDYVVREYSRTVRSEGVLKDCSEGHTQGLYVVREYSRAARSEGVLKDCT